MVCMGRRMSGVGVGLLLLCPALVVADPPTPPVAELRAHEATVLGHKRVDPYFWLRDRDDPRVIAYLQAENAYAEAMTAHTKPLQETLYKEMLARIKQTDRSALYPHDNYFYYTRTEEGKQYVTWCRRTGTVEAPEEILLDENAMANGKEYFELTNFEPSPDHRLLAYAVDSSGNEKFDLFVRNISTGEVLDGPIPNTYYTLAWGSDNRTLFYTVLDEALRPWKVMRHVLGENPGQDTVAFEEPDDRFFVEVERTRSGRFVLVSSESKITSEVRFVDADQPAQALKVVAPRRQGVEYSVEHQGDRFLIVTNDGGAINFKLVEAPLSAPGVENWKELIPHRPQVKLEGVDPFARFLVIYEREGGYDQIRVQNLADNQVHRIEMPEPVYTAGGDENDNYDTQTLRFTYSSLVTPHSIYDYDMATRTRTLVKRDEVLGGYDPARYESQRVVAKAPDNAEVPLSIVYRKGAKLDGDNPLLLYGYGAYGIPEDPDFSSARVSLLDRGVVFAIAHVRGGGEMGRPWYDNGKLLNKKNTFTDFIACAERLIELKYTRPQRLAIVGGSAGGLLMGAVTNMRPDLFNAVVAQVPFVDVVNTMLDESIPLTVTEFEEWGNPAEAPFYDYMMSYSPYDNVLPRAYPNMLIRAGLNDPRVQYWEPAKWTAKLRSVWKGDHHLLLLTNMGAGHGGASGRYDRLREVAGDYAFILDHIGDRQPAAH